MKKCKLNFEDVINPNEYGSLLYDSEEKNAIDKILLKEKIFRYATDFESESTKFEKNICKYLNCKFALGVNNGTSGLIVALRSIDIQKDDRVLVSSYTFLSTATSVLSFGAIPVPMDFDFENGINLEDLEIELKKGAKAIILVHLQGRTFDIKPILILAKKYNAFVIEDACQAFGSKYNGKYAGTFGDIGIFSFHQNKQISSGEGGVVVTNSSKIYNLARNYHDMGSVRKIYPSWEEKDAVFGYNYRINNMQSAILNVQLKKLEKIIKIQKNNYDKIVKDINSNEIVVPNDMKGFTGQNILIYTEDLKKINNLEKIAELNNVEIRKIWNMPYDMRGVFYRNGLNSKKIKGKENKNSSNIAKYLIAISVPPILSNEDIKTIRKVIVEGLEISE